MKKIKLSKGAFELNEKKTFINSGEIHYYRIKPELWDNHLLKAAQAGLNTVSTYIPWCVHEPSEGKFDLKEFNDFADRVKEHNLFLIARVGPVSNAELKKEGLPEWINEKYPQICLQGKEIENLPHTTLVAYNNPKFIQLVERWYDNVIPEVAKRQYHRSGVIIAVQLCNEIGMVHWLNKAADYNSYSEEMYRDFLRKRYGKVEELNKVYNTEYESFSSIRQPVEISIRADDNLLLYYDWMYYYFEYFGKYYKKLYEMAKKRGVEVPVIANIPHFYDYDVRGRGVFSPMTSLMFSEFKNYVPEVIFGGAYQMRRFDYENFHDVLITSDILKMISSENVPVICSELQTGIMRDRPRIYPSDVEHNLKTSTASGLNGLNAYMFSGGENKDGIGAMGVYHQWQAAVDSKGNPRPHYDSLKQFGRIIKSFSEELASTTKVNDFTVGFYKPYYATEYLKGPFIEDIEDKRTRHFYDGLGRLLYLAGYSYDFTDIQKIKKENLFKKEKLVLYSMGFMDEVTQTKLAEYVENGGSLLLYPDIPVKNLKGERCTVLADRLNIKNKGVIPGKFCYIDNIEVLLDGEMKEISSPGAKTAANSREGKTCALVKDCGEGRAAVFCMPLTHIYDYMIDVIEKMVSMIGVEKRVERNSKSQVITIFRENGSQGFLFVGNYQEIPRETWVEIKNKAGDVIRIPEDGRMHIPPRQTHILPVNVKTGIGGLKIIYSTLEIESVCSKGSSVELKTRKSPFSGEMMLSGSKPESVEVENREIPFSHNESNVKFVLPENTKKVKLNYKKELSELKKGAYGR